MLIGSTRLQIEVKSNKKIMKRILMVLAPREFRDLEYIVPRSFFELAQIDVISTSTEYISVWRFWYNVKHNWLISDYKKENFDAIVFVGWVWSLELVNNQDLEQMANFYMQSWKIVAAICAAPRNLLSWWVANWKKITWNNWDNNFEKLAIENWAIPEMKWVVVDSNLITWYWPESVESFARAIIERLNNN